MKFFAYALLISTTQAATALVAPTACHDAAVNTAVAAGTGDATKAKAVADAALACTTTLVIATGDALIKGKVIENGLMAPQKVTFDALTPKPTAADWTAYLVAADAFGAALGMGKLSCAAGATCATRALLKGTLANQVAAFTFAGSYYKAMKTNCELATFGGFADKAKCTADGFAKLTAMGTAMAAADFYSVKTVAARTTWSTAQDVINVAAAIAAKAPAAGTVGFPCNAAAAVAPATVGVRPACAAANCCMGHKALPADLTNSVNGEVCQLKTALKGAVVTTKASAKATSCYVAFTAAVTAEQDGACIEGAVRTASAALSVLAAAYMMA